jgi:glycerophosphoryl diester phosphodiesterase
VLAAAALAACGGDDGAAPTTTTASSTAATEAPTTTTETALPAGALVVAHRGASGYAPEHTFAAYDLALEQGADYIEQDLQMTADGVLVVLHDETLDRTARGPAESCTGPVSARTLEELQACDVGSWFNEEHPDLADAAFAELRIPTMAEVFERYGPDVRYYIETKSPEAQPGMEQALIDLLDDVGLAGTAASARQVLIQSFSAASLELIHSIRPELPLVQLLPVGAVIDEATLDRISEYAVGVGPFFGNVDADAVDAAHARCLDVHPYTVDAPADMARLLDAGVDGMFTNVPDVLLERREEHAPPPQHCSPART